MWVLRLVVSLLCCSVAAFTHAATLIWTDNSSGTSQEDYFVVERKELGGIYADIAHPAQDATIFTDTQVTPGLTYIWRIKAVNVAGESPYSNEASLLIPINTAGIPQIACLYTPTPPTPPPPAGRVLALDCNAGSGITVLDASGWANHGTISGATWTTQGKYGAALVFDGVNDWVTVNDAASLDVTTALTISAWIYPTALNGGSTNGWRTVLLKEAGGTASYDLYANQDTNRPSSYVSIGGIDRGVVGPTQLPLNTWTHLTATYGGGQQRLFVNGVQVATRAQTGNVLLSTGPLRIGGNLVWGEYFQGRIDEVRMYNRVLTAQEIQTDMARMN